MEIDRIKQSISHLLDVGGTVSFSYKRDIDSWYAEIKLYHFAEENEWFINNGPISGTFKNKEEAVDKYVMFMFSEKNMAYCIERLTKKLDISSDEFFEFPRTEVLEMIEEEKKLIVQELNSQNIYVKGTTIIERIFQEDNIDMVKIITESANGVEPKKVRELYCHMSTLCLNVLLNRLNELGRGAETTAREVQKILHKLIAEYDVSEQKKLILKNASNQC
jgi:hypothetical protein